MNTYVKDSKYEKTFTIKNTEENSFPNFENEEKEIDNKRFKINENKDIIIPQEEIEFLINKKRSELDIKIYNMITKNHIKKKKLKIYIIMKRMKKRRKNY